MTNPLPKKLEDALRDQPRYKPAAPMSPESLLSSLLSDKGVGPPADDHSFERGMLESILNGGRKGPSSTGGGLFSKGASTSAKTNTSGGLFPGRTDRAGRGLTSDPNAQNVRPDGDWSLPKRTERVQSDLVSALYSSDAVCGSPGGPDSEGRAEDAAAASATGGQSDAPWPAQQLSSSSRGSAEAELVASMAARLSRLETASRDLRRELVAKDKELLRVRRDHDALERLVGTEGGGDQTAAVREARRLEADNARLRLQVAEMTAFLSDYGLVWKGATAADTEQLEGGGETTPAAEAGGWAGAGNAAKAGAVDSWTPNFPALFAKIKELNSIMDSASAKVVKHGQK
jgi:hypothetical protein